MQFNSYNSAGAHIAAALANEPPTDAERFAALLDGYDVHEPMPTEAQLTEIREWAARLRTVFEATTDAEQASIVDALLIASDCRPRLISHNSLPFHLHYAPLTDDLATRTKGLTAAGLAHVITEAGGQRLGSCHRAGCPTVFVDTSRNGTRHFCSVRCANIVNVANHRARRRGGSACAVPETRASIVRPDQRYSAKAPASPLT